MTEKRISKFLDSMDVSVDIQDDRGQRSSSWAVISIQGYRSDFVKFVDLSTRDIMEIERFLRQFDRSNRRPTIDCSPRTSDYLRIDRRTKF